MKKFPIIWIIAYSFCALLLFFLIYAEITLADLRLHVSFLNIGQGDAALITTPTGKHILVDGGPQTNIMESLPQKLSFFDDTIDLMVLTHPHADHLDGLIPVLKRYRVKAILYAGVDTYSESYKAFRELIADKKIYIARSKQDFEIEKGLYFDMVAPLSSLEKKSFKADELNNTSVVFRLIYGKTAMLFTGDMEQEEENQVLLSGNNIQSYLLKAGHHGSNTSSTPAFLDFIKPRIATISAGKNNSFKHPRPQTISALKERDVQIYRTDEQGTIDAVCGKNNDCSFSWEKHPKEFKQ